MKGDWPAGLLRNAGSVWRKHFADRNVRRQIASESAKPAGADSQFLLSNFLVLTAAPMSHR